MNGRRAWKKPVGYVSVVILLLVPPLFTSIVNVYHIHLAIIILLYIIAASSLRTIYLSGQVSLGHAAFVAIGAYTSALLALKLGWTPWVTMPLAALAALIIAFLVACAFSRIRAIYFAIVTVFFGVSIQAVITGLPGLTGGYSGLTGIPPLDSITIPGVLHIDFVASPLPSYYFFLVLALLSLLILYRLEHSRIGMIWRSIAQSPSVALSVGINEAGYRILVFAIGGFFAGIAGAGFAHHIGVLSSASYGIMASIYLLAYVLVGGVRKFAGPIIGTIVLVLVPEVVSGLKEYAPFVVAGAMLLVVFGMPQGVAGLPEQVTSWFRTLSGRRVSGNAS